MKKKIVWILHEGNVSGANLGATDYARVLASNGADITWVIPSKGNFYSALQEISEKVYVIGFYGWMVRLGQMPSKINVLKQRIRNILSILKLAWLILKIKPDYVFTNTITFSLGGIASLLTLKKHYWFIHEFGEEDHGIKVFPYSSYGYKFLGLLSKKVIVNSKATYNKFSTLINTDKLKICYIPIKSKQHLKVNPEIKSDHIYSFILIGQITEGKGHLEVLRSFSIIEKEFTNYKLNIYGNIVDKEYYDKLVQFIDSNALKSRVKFHPNTNEPLKVIAEHDFLIMASRMEAFGKVTFEALSVGTPVIGNNSGGTKELVKNGFNGLLYSNENELVNIISSILNNKVRIEEFSKNATIFIRDNYNYNELSKNLLEVLSLK